MRRTVSMGENTSGHGKRETGNVIDSSPRFPYPVARFPTNRHFVGGQGISVSQRYDRIQCGSPPRPPDAEEQSDDRAEDERDENGEDMDGRSPMRDFRQRHRAKRAGQ